MSAVGQDRRFSDVRALSVLTPIASESARSGMAEKCTIADLNSIDHGRPTGTDEQWSCAIMGLSACVDLVLRFGSEIAGVMPLAQLFFKLPAGAVDHSSALYGRTLADFFRPAH